MLTIEKKPVKVGKFVSTEHVETVRRNYKEHRWLQNSKRIGKVDSLSVWFSLADIEDFLEKLKEHGGDGVRFYFGAYNKEYAEKPLYAGRQTIVMVATRQKQTLNGETNKDIYITTEKGTNILAYNVGRPCPPLCQGGNDDGIDISIVDKNPDELIIL
ncbi:MAG: hypothetical protein U0U70_02800 [Chitinophagaceae bacterium]